MYFTWNERLEPVKVVDQNDEKRKENLPVKHGVMNSQNRFCMAFFARFTETEHSASFFKQATCRNDYVRWVTIRHSVIYWSIDRRTHTKLPTDTYWPRNLATRRRAPASVHDGTICFGFNRRQLFIPSKSWAADFPACKHASISMLYRKSYQISNINWQN